MVGVHVPARADGFGAAGFAGKGYRVGGFGLLLFGVVVEARGGDVVVVRTARLFADDAAAQGDAVFGGVAFGQCRAQAAFAVFQADAHFGLVQAVFAVFQVFGLRAVQHAHLCAVGVVLVECAVGERQAHRVFDKGQDGAAVFALPPPQGDDGGCGNPEEIAAVHGRASAIHRLPLPVGEGQRMTLAICGRRCAKAHPMIFLFTYR